MVGKTILIVEDDPTMLRGLTDNFCLQGYDVTNATDGEKGLDIALQTNPDLIVLDIMLPKVNGFEICRHLREAKLDMAVIMLTAKGQEKDVVMGLNLGADDYVTKPFSIKELLARANALLRRQGVDAATIYYFGDCKLDLSSHKLLRSGAEMKLTPKEFGLLQLLVGRAGRALTRNEIMRCVWGSALLVIPRSIDRCISTLRTKIEPDPHQPTFIRTVRDIGYRFEMPVERGNR